MVEQKCKINISGSSKKGFGSTPTDVDSSVTLEGEDYGFMPKINV